MYVMSREGCKEIDRVTIEELEVPSIVLMENAANEVYLKIKDLGESYTVICGNGNNGGDGLAIGRKLFLEGKKINFIIVSQRDKYTQDFNVNYKILDNLECDIRFVKEENDIDLLLDIINENKIIVDCIFGVGINKELNEFYINVIKVINNSKKFIISIDVPSGLDCNTGVKRGAAIKANVTYSFEVLKKGFLNYNALKYLGKLDVISIGIPGMVKQRISEGVQILDEKSYKKMIRVREVYGHKGDYGRAIIFAGSEGFIGAGYLATQACLKTGAGLTTLITTPKAQDILSGMIIEAMTANFTEVDKIKNLINNANAIAYGPGVASEYKYEEFLLTVSKESSSHIVIDAEGINILARRTDILSELKGRMILTPHPGEMSRLVNKSIEEIEANRIEIAKGFAKEYESIVLLKGYNTVITDGENVYINTTGCSKMASGGSGDCLTGMIVSLLAQKHSPLESALLGAYIHGLAAEVGGSKKYSITAEEIIGYISNIINSIIM